MRINRVRDLQLCDAFYITQELDMQKALQVYSRSPKSNFKPFLGNKTKP